MFSSRLQYGRCGQIVAGSGTYIGDRRGIAVEIIGSLRILKLWRFRFSDDNTGSSR